MGALRERFWERDLADLTRAEWEALCDGCGRCCLHKIEYEDTGEIVDTNVACQLLDTKTARCTDYRGRKAKVPDCVRLTLRIVGEARWLPDSCAYRRRAEGRELPGWHPLLSGDPDGAMAGGASVAGRVVSEVDAGPLEHHVVDWDADDDAEGSADP
jgi:uncharacterized cysteine cluster protein YcgN (CxxCxxCC family)